MVVPALGFGILVFFIVVAGFTMVILNLIANREGWEQPFYENTKDKKIENVSYMVGGFAVVLLIILLIKVPHDWGIIILIALTAIGIIGGLATFLIPYIKSSSNGVMIGRQGKTESKKEEKRASPDQQVVDQADRKALARLNYKRSIRVDQDDLGKEKLIRFKRKLYYVTIPRQINKDLIIRLNGLGKTKNGFTGDLFLYVHLNKGDDINKIIWISVTDASNGAEKKIYLDGKKIVITIPPKSHDGLTIRLKGLGKKASFNWRAPFLLPKNGNALIKLHIYPDSIIPRYGTFDMLSTENMLLEGWVYNKFDYIVYKIGRSSFLADPLGAEAIANLFNEGGCRAIFDALTNHLELDNLNINLTIASLITKPGECQKSVVYKDNFPDFNTYMITINQQFIDNPFSIAAILAHELCHVFYSEKIHDETTLPGNESKTYEFSIDIERTVDLLVFMFKLGDFQLRVARDNRVTLVDSQSSI